MKTPTIAQWFVAQVDYGTAPEPNSAALINLHKRAALRDLILIIRPGFGPE
jgi:hypothetical protein